MSPEQAMGIAFDAASDWYAVGVMLFEALTGRLPFEGSIPEIMLGKCERDPVRPSDLVRGVPVTLEALCMGLIARNPDERPGGDGIAGQLGGVGLATGAHTSRRTTGDVFVGRSDALRALEGNPRVTSTGGPRMLLVHGASGVGKTTLARRFLRDLEAHGNTLALQGRCYERESVPFKAWDGVVEALVEYLAALSPTDRDALMPRHRHVLPRLFPAFGKLVAVSDAPPDEDLTVDRARAFRAFGELMGRLSDRLRLVLFIDDLHWADLDSALLMRELFEGKDPPALTVLGTYRPDEAQDSPFFHELSSLERGTATFDIARLSITALSIADAQTLARELLGRLGIANPGLAAHIAGESEGVPLFVHELVRHASDSGPQTRSPSHISLSEALGRRIARLPAAAISLLEVLAVAGRPITQRVAYGAARVALEDQATLHALRAAALAKSRGGAPSDVAEIYHDRIREVVVASLPQARLVAVHANLLSQLEQGGDGDLELLVAHSLGAERPERALAYAERAAVRARTALAFNRSAELFRTALACLAQLPSPDRQRRASLEQRFAEALAAAGCCLEAAKAYQRAAALSTPEQVPRLERHAADQLLRGGDLSAGIALLKRVLARHDISYPSGARTALTALGLERTRLAARGLSFVERAPEALDPHDAEAIDALRIALGVYWLVEPVRGALFATQYLRRALDAGDARRVLRGLETEGAYIALTGGPRAEHKASEIYARCASLAQRTGSANTLGGLKFAEAGFHAIYGRKAKSAECAALALSQPNQPGLSWERAYARFHLYQSCVYVGGRPGLAHEIESAVQEGHARHDRFAVATLLPMLNMARLMSDEPALAVEATERMRPELSPDVFSFLDTQEMLWGSIAHTYMGDYATALGHYAARHGRYAASGMPRLQVWRVLYTWGTLLAQLGELSQKPDDRRGRAAALEKIKEIEAEALIWPLCFASAGRATLAHFEGHDDTRESMLRQAVQQADALGYHAFAAVYRLTASELRGDAEDARAQTGRLAELGIANARGWQRAWTPGLGPR